MPAAPSGSRRLFAVIPAAGRSRRMGRPKLLLPLGGRTVLARLLSALQQPEIVDRVVVLRSDDEPLRREAAACGATVVQPADDPPDMRASVEEALGAIRDRHAPRPEDGWLLIPADHPVLDPRVLRTLIAVWNRDRPGILVPVFRGRRGHPAVFRWSLAEAVSSIPSDRGLNWLVRSRAGDIQEHALDDRSILIDLDTPEDYESLLRQWGT